MSEDKPPASPAQPDGTQSVLAKIVEGLSGHPPLLLALGGVIVLAGLAGSIAGQTWLLVVAIVIVLIAGLGAWIWTQRAPAARRGDSHVLRAGGKLDVGDDATVFSRSGPGAGEADLTTDMRAGGDVVIGAGATVGSVDSTGRPARAPDSAARSGAPDQTAPTAPAAASAATPVASPADSSAPAGSSGPTAASSAPAADSVPGGTKSGGSEATPRPPPAPCKPFVGRTEIIERLLSTIETPGERLLLQVGGTWGIGKTWLADELGRQAREKHGSGRVYVLSCRAGSFAPPQRPGPGSSPDAHELRESFDSFARILEALCRSASLDSDSATQSIPEGIAGLALKVRASREAVLRAAHPGTSVVNVSLEAGGSISIGEGSAIGTVAVAGAGETIGHQVDLLKDAFVEGLNELGRLTGVVVLIDELDRLQGHLVATWLLELVAGLDSAAVVVTTREAGSEPATYRELAEPTPLSLFEVGDVRAYLVSCLGAGAVSDELVGRVFDFSNGLPQAVGMAGDLILRRMQAGGDTHLTDLEMTDPTPVETLLATIVEELGTADEAVLIERGRFARRIDVDLSHYLLFGMPLDDGSPEQQARARSALERLVSFSFIDTVDPNGLDGIGRYAFHEYIRGRPERDANEAVHATIAAFYESRLAAYDEGNATETSYMQWYKYEQAEWKALIGEWLYHSGQLNDPTSRGFARLELARIFLEAFWWWECYADLPYCDQMLADWEASQPGGDPTWPGHLREILRSYPKGWRKLDRGDWAAVERALVALRRESGTDHALPVADAGDGSEAERRRRRSRRRVRGMSSLLLAHAHRYRSGQAERASAFYDDALRYFEADPDAALEVWTTFEQADLALELGDADEARTRLAAVARNVLDETPDDLELRANLQRLRGDLAVAAGEPPATAVAASVSALLRAAAFLAEPNDMPDPYTVAFYEEHRERLADRMVWAASLEDPGEVWDHMAGGLVPVMGTTADRAAILAALAAADRPALADLISPPPPPVGSDSIGNPAMGGAVRSLKALLRDGADEALASTVPAPPAATAPPSVTAPPAATAPPDTRGPSAGGTESADSAGPVAASPAVGSTPPAAPTPSPSAPAAPAPAPSAPASTAQPGTPG